MTIEEKLKEYILTKHKSIREFVKYANLPYSTVDGILKRGIANSSIGNVLKICKALQISADELANNRIVPRGSKVSTRIIMSEIPDLIAFMEKNKREYDDMTIDGKSLSDDEWEIVLNSMTLTVDFVRTWRQHKIEKENAK